MTDSNGEENGRSREKRSLSIREEQGNLLTKALQGLSEDQHKELMGKAAEEALNVHKDAAQREVKSNAAFRDIHEHVSAVERLDTGRSLSTHHVKSEIETGSGKMTISSRKGPGCFVATAVFGGANAPEVAYFRHFRDSVLERSITGRRFISWYYRNGPALADWIEKHPWAKGAVRLSLSGIEKALRLRFSFPR